MTAERSKTSRSFPNLFTTSRRDNVLGYLFWGYELGDELSDKLYHQEGARTKLEAQFRSRH